MMEISIESFDGKPLIGSKKFIVIEKNNKFYVIFFHLDESHYSVVKRKEETDSKLVGAGFIHPKTKQIFKKGKIIDREIVFYESDSCLKEFGYDRPKDEELGKKILDFIKNEVKKNN